MTNLERARPIAALPREIQVELMRQAAQLTEALPGRLFCRRDAKPRFHAERVSQCTARRIKPFPPFAD